MGTQLSSVPGVADVQGVRIARIQVSRRADCGCRRGYSGVEPSRDLACDLRQYR